jgi:hypothetical protein
MVSLSRRVVFERWYGSLDGTFVVGRGSSVGIADVGAQELWGRYKVLLNLMAVV